MLQPNLIGLHTPNGADNLSHTCVTLLDPNNFYSIFFIHLYKYMNISFSIFDHVILRILNIGTVLEYIIILNEINLIFVGKWFVYKIQLLTISQNNIVFI